MSIREELTKAKRIVVKVGTSTLTHANGKPHLFRMERLVRELSDLRNQGKEVVLVSSGAVAVGMAKMGMHERPSEIPKKQALAAIGQGILMHMYEKMFAEYGQTSAQVLLTRENSVKHNQYQNSRNALQALLDMDIIPVVNENDAVAVDELKIGDNDTLSATVATLVDADLLIILSDIEGVYTANPQTNPKAELISEITDITPQVEEMAGGAGSARGTGGMFTKIQAAKIAVNSGVAMIIASGTRKYVLRDVVAGRSVGTLFPARESHLRVRKSWLAFGTRIKGDITVDDGCSRAMLKNGSSLLAAGIISAEGEFKAGNTVRVLAVDGREIARGIVNYDAEILLKLMGRNSQEFSGILGDDYTDEVIHRDNMVLMA